LGLLIVYKIPSICGRRYGDFHSGWTISGLQDVGQLDVGTGTGTAVTRPIEDRLLLPQESPPAVPITCLAFFKSCH